MTSKELASAEAILSKSESSLATATAGHSAAQGAVEKARGAYSQAIERGDNDAALKAKTAVGEAEVARDIAALKRDRLASAHADATRVRDMAALRAAERVSSWEGILTMVGADIASLARLRSEVADVIGRLGSSFETASAAHGKAVEMRRALGLPGVGDGVPFGALLALALRENSRGAPSNAIRAEWLEAETDPTRRDHRTCYLFGLAPGAGQGMAEQLLAHGSIVAVVRAANGG